MKSATINEGQLRILVRNLRTKRYEKYKVQGDTFSVVSGEEGQKDKSGF